MKTKLIKEILEILSDIHPECDVEGHRVHTTFNKGDESWPEWGVCAYGIAGGFVHFENEDDQNAWVARQKQAEDMNKPAKTDELHAFDYGMHGRCVNECRPIGFYRGVA